MDVTTIIGVIVFPSFSVIRRCCSYLSFILRFMRSLVSTAHSPSQQHQLFFFREYCNKIAETTSTKWSRLYQRYQQVCMRMIKPQLLQRHRVSPKQSQRLNRGLYDVSKILQLIRLYTDTIILFERMHRIGRGDEVKMIKRIIFSFKWMPHSILFLLDGRGQ